MAIRTAVTVALLSVLMCEANYAANIVTVYNFVRAESDSYFQRYVDNGGFGQFIHRRNPTPINDQGVIRANRDTLYSVGVFDLSTPVSIHKPDTGSRFQSMQIISQDHYSIQVAYEPGQYTISREMVGTRYAVVLFRTRVDSSAPEDIEAANAIQDQIVVTQKSRGNFVVPDWDLASLSRIRNAINVLGAGVATNEGVYGDVDEVNPISHLIGTAYGWGGNPIKDTVYLNVVPTRNEGIVPYTLAIGDVPVDGFWSISVYNREGFFEENDWHAYSVDSQTAIKEQDGHVIIRFGGDPTAANYLHIMDGWNYTVRLFRPKAQILDGAWEFPEARQVPGN